MTKVDEHDYYSLFKKHCVQKAPEPKYASAYEAWFFHNSIIVTIEILQMSQKSPLMSIHIDSKIMLPKQS